MKNLITFSILSLFLSCTKIQILDGFGKVKIGMSFYDFNQEYPNVKLNEFDLYEFDSLPISKQITLHNVKIEFRNGKLFSVRAKYNKSLFDKIYNEFGIVRQTRNNDVNLILFNTNSPDYSCVYESVGGHSGMAIFDKKELDRSH